MVSVVVGKDPSGSSHAGDRFEYGLGREVRRKLDADDGCHGFLPGERRLARVSCDPSLAAG